MPLLTGRQPRAFDPSVPHASTMLSARRALAPIPVKVNYADPLPADLGMMLNDRYGCCTAAAAFHARQVWSRYATGVEETESDTEVLTFYERFGFKPADPRTDVGAVEQTVLTDWITEGLPVASGPDKLAAFAEVDARNLDDLRRIIFSCGLAYIGFGVPDGFMEVLPQVWDINTNYGAVRDGHCVILTGYDAAQGTFNVVSWGRKDYTMTSAFVQKYVDEAYGLVDRGFLEASGHTPLGWTLDDWIAQMQALKAS